MPRQNGNRRHATMYDFRDLDLMLKLVDRGDQDGWVETPELATSIGFADDDLRSIGNRLGWMRHYGMVEREKDKARWRVTDGGERVIEARLRAAQQRTLEALPDEAMIEVMANVTARYQHGSPLVAVMLRREFMYGTKPR